MLTVHLQQLIFQGSHGLYEGEALTGNTFEVSLDVSYDEKKITLGDINQLINYETLFAIVKKRMANPTPLLEALAESIVKKIKHDFPMVKTISISIYKMSAPIKGLDGKVGITLLKKYDD